MKKDPVKILLGIYNLMISISAFVIGITMISSNHILLTNTLKEVMEHIPFSSWLVPGIIIVVVFGVGNIIASVLCFVKKGKFYMILSCITGVLIILCSLLQVFLIKNMYTIIIQFMGIGIIQIILTLIIYLRNKHTMDVE